MNTLKNSMAALLLIIALSLFASSGVCCDFDGDGTDDPFSLREENGTASFEAFLSSGGTLLRTSFSPTNAIPAPGNYYSTMLANPGYIDIDTFFWTIERPDMNDDRLNFGIENVSYLPGRDWNGDGITDLGKFLNRCGPRLKRRCARGPVTGNFLFNATDGSETFFGAPSTGTGFFGKGGSDIFAADADNDGSDDVCFTLPGRRNPRQFRIQCKSPVSDQVVYKKSVGRIFESPFSVKINGVTNIVTWKQRKKQNGLLLFFYDTQSNTKRRVPLDNVPLNASPNRPLVGDWLGIGSQQIALASSEGIALYEPASASLSSISFPAGVPFDCNTTVQGDEMKSTLTSRNVCRVFKSQCS